MNAGNIKKINRNQALEIARNYFANPENNCSSYTVESVSTLQELGDTNMNPYLTLGIDLEHCWIGYIDKHDDFIGLRSSTVILISQIDGKVCITCANDEG